VVWLWRAQLAARVDQVRRRASALGQAMGCTVGLSLGDKIPRD